MQIQSADSYRKESEYCRSRAVIAADDRERSEWDRLARLWLTLAEETLEENKPSKNQS